MSQSSTTLHEPAGRLSDRTVDLHRALVSLQEELEAIDWYRQRADACRDEALGQILEHNLREEIEHAAMLLEWLRRHHADFAGQMATYLDSEGPITEVEEQARGADVAAVEAPADDSEPGAAAESFTVGTLKEPT